VTKVPKKGKTQMFRRVGQRPNKTYKEKHTDGGPVNPARKLVETGGKESNWQSVPKKRKKDRGCSVFHQPPNGRNGNSKMCVRKKKQ